MVTIHVIVIQRLWFYTFSNKNRRFIFSACDVLSPACDHFHLNCHVNFKFPDHDVYFSFFGEEGRYHAFYIAYFICFIPKLCLRDSKQGQYCLNAVFPCVIKNTNTLVWYELHAGTNVNSLKLFTCFRLTMKDVT